MTYLSFELLLDQFLSYQVLRKDSQITYKKIISYFVKEHKGKFPDDITIIDVISWRKKILMNIKPVSWNTYARHLQALINFGIKKKLLKRKDNPFSSLQIKSDERPIKYLNEYQLKQLDCFLMECGSNNKLKFIKPSWFFITLVKTFQYTGMRKKQLLNLKVQDIRISEGVITIDGTQNKNHMSHIIPISTKLKPYLVELIDKHKQKSSFATDQLFNINLFKENNIIAKEMSVFQVDAIFKKLTEQINFKVNPHRFRHTVATTILKNSNNIYLAQKILGHQSIKTTMHYIGHDVELLREGIEMI
ncbi:site-specific integrase [Acinetobacter bereziniae]|uniref:tyrosine-type recombinase/integrase n=1 Tax=Acinetobacter bereziniae TaxID=106648 RepID=UPI001900A2A4|nr:site-specific integrase [Acinetobacter bereziniae]MBJ9947574.1 site-specific integrase [Acinetobacter bereziniae]